MNTVNKMAKVIYDALESKKGMDIKVIKIAEISVLADYFILANGTNSSQIQAMIDEVQRKMHEAGFELKRLEGNRSSSWILLDYGDVVAHIFNPQDRLFYDLERIWSDGQIIEPEEL